MWRSLPPPPRHAQVISNYTKKLVSTDPEANPIRGPFQPPSWELPEGSEYPDVSDDESEGEEINTGDRPVSLDETRREMEERMEKKVKGSVTYFENRHGVGVRVGFSAEDCVP